MCCGLAKGAVRERVVELRSYHGDLRLFCEYAADPRYEWTAVCERLFGTHPAHVCFEWNTAVHAAEYEGEAGRRALAKRELQELFDYADERVAQARERGRKGWLTALRDATALKTGYAFGLRRRELVMLDLADFGANPQAPEFGGYGVVYVRWGKASKGSPPKRRSVLTVSRGRRGCSSSGPGSSVACSAKLPLVVGRCGPANAQRGCHWRRSAPGSPATATRSACQTAFHCTACAIPISRT
jgi:integrase